jgi:nitroreductase
MPQMSTHPGLPISRRSLLMAAGAACALPAAPVEAAMTTELSVTDALRQRRSVRAFSDRTVDPALLAELLWAAFGINRVADGLHTAPSWRGAADVIVHAATADGIVVYDPESNAARVWKAGDIRARLSPQPFVATAPVCLVFVSDFRRLKAAGPDDEKRLYAMVDAAMVSENTYLFAAARGLGTCLVGGIDRDGIAAGLGLARHEFPTFVQPIGWPV